MKSVNVKPVVTLKVIHKGKRVEEIKEKNFCFMCGCFQGGKPVRDGGV